jgi:hypothetical protein
VAIAHGSEILSVANTAGPGNFETNITPAATPNAVCVIVHCASTTDLVTSVQYGTGAGAVTLTRAASPYGFAVDTTEAGAIYIYWAGDSAVFPSGTQTVRVVRGGTTQNMRYAISTMTCAVGQIITVDVGNSFFSASAANPAVALNTTVAVTQCYLGVHSGITTMTNTPATNWTLAPTPGFEDFGAQGRGWARRFFNTGPGNAAPGWTIGADDYVISAAAFREAPPPPAGPTGLPTLVAPPPYFRR